jgi:propanol-preferring alcohol dehydrogenase
MAFIVAPVGDLVPAELRVVRKGRRVVCGGIHISDIPQYPYWLHCEERQIASVANQNCHDTLNILSIAPETQVGTQTVRHPLEAANEAREDLRSGRLQNAAVLIP